MTFLRRLLELPFLVILMGIGSAIMAMPAAYAVVLGQFDIARAFFYAGTVLLIVTAMIALATATSRARGPSDRQLDAVIGSYLVLPIIFAVPVHQAMPGLPFSVAWFEMLSSFTTTGATLFETPGVVAAPIHLWRATVGWLGGFYTLLIAACILAPVGLGGVELLGVRTSGNASGSGPVTTIAEPSQRVIQFATQLFPVYAGLTVILWIGLLVSGDSAFVALCHAMGVLSASGISPLQGLGPDGSGVLGEVMIFTFFGLAVTRRFWPGAVMVDQTLKLWKDPEIRLAVGLVTFVTAVLVLRHAAMMMQSPEVQGLATSARAVWGSAFTALSFLTTTGFQSEYWPEIGSPGLVLLGLAMIGGGVATTAGGVKLLRVYALLRHGERELERIVHPHSIGGHGQVARRLRRQGAYLAWIFFMIFGLSIALITATLTLTGLGFREALVLGIACLSSTGQLATVFGDTPISYAGLGPTAHGILGAAMILGRLEILAIFAFLIPKGWSH